MNCSRAQRLFLIVSIAALSLLTACGGAGGRDDSFPRVSSLGSGEVFAKAVNSSLTVGENRFMLQLLDAEESPVLDAEVHLRFFDLNGDKPLPSGEADARFIPVETGYVDEQSGGKREVTGRDGVYVAPVSFGRAGDWGVRIRVKAGERSYEEFPFRFNVRERSDEPMVGDAVPRTAQATLASTPDIEEIDSSSPARPQMHDQTVADAVMSGKPTVIAFATPAYCRSRLCAPVMDTVMDPLFASYRDRAAFIHIEPYALRDLRAGFVENPVPATMEWRLHSEPWVFVVGADGRVAAKFEGIMALDEVETALRAALGG